MLECEDENLHTFEEAALMLLRILLLWRDVQRQKQSLSCHRHDNQWSENLPMIRKNQVDWRSEVESTLSTPRTTNPKGTNMKQHLISAQAPVTR
jgi:hypothetical protein